MSYKNNLVNQAISSQEEIDNEIEQIAPETQIDFKGSVQYFQQGPSDYKVLSTRFDPLNKYISFGCDDGSIRIMKNNEPYGQPVYVLKQQYQSEKSPMTNAIWKPVDESSQIKNLILSSTTNGDLLYWHVTSQKIIKQIHEEGNSIYAIDFNKDGSWFASGGQDLNIRLYNEEKLSNVQVLREGNAPTHSNRIFALQFCKDDNNLLISAGWDQTILIWDLRTGRSEQFIHGPMICGDSLDYQNGKILTGSHRNEKQLQLWDMRKLQWAHTFEWPFDDKQQPFVYCCKFGKSNPDLIFAGSTGLNEIRVFSQKNQKYKSLSTFSSQKGILTLDCSPYDNRVSFGGSDSYCGILDFDVTIS